MRRRKRKFTIRKCLGGKDRKSASYLVPRVFPQGRGASAGYRFAKVSRDQATTFSCESEASRIMNSLHRCDRKGNYSLITL